MRFCMGAENAKMKSAEKSAETGGHQTAPVVLHAASTPYQKTNEKCKLWTLSVP